MVLAISTPWRRSASPAVSAEVDGAEGLGAYFPRVKYFDGLKMFSRGEEVKHQQGDRETSALPLT